VLLCQLIEKLIGMAKKNIAVKYKTDAKQAFVQRDNLTKFLEACKALGVNDITRFEVDDLYERKNEKLVVNTLLSLSRWAKKTVDVTPPLIVQYELEIDAEEKAKNKTAIEEGEEDDGEDDDDGKDSAPPSPAKGGAAASSPIAAPAPVDIGKPSPSAASMAPASAAEPVVASTSFPTSPSKASTDDSKMHGYKYLPYSAKKGDDIDLLVGAAVNNNYLDIDIKQVQIKKKKRRRDAKHKGEYIVVGHRVHVRVLQGVLVARFGGEWQNFVRFAEELLGYEEVDE